MDNFARNLLSVKTPLIPFGEYGPASAYSGIVDDVFLDKLYPTITPDATIAAPVIDKKHKWAIFTVGVPNTILVKARGETSGTFYVDGVSIGAAYNLGYNNWSIGWTPAAIAREAVITFVGAVTGASEPVSVVVSRARSYTHDMTSWAGTASCAAAPTLVSPRGSGMVYRAFAPSATTASHYIAKAASPANAVANAGFAIWVGLKATGIFRCLQFNFASGGGYFNFDTEESTVGDNYVASLLTEVVGDITWKLIWVQRTDLAPGGIQSTMFIYLTRVIGTASVTVSAGELANAEVYFFDPYAIGDQALPFTAAMKLSWHKDAGATTTLAVTNGEEWKYKHPYHDQESQMSGGAYPGGLIIRTIKPTGWTSTGNYPVLVFPPAVSDSGETSAGNKTAWEAAKDAAADYANTYGCVVCVPYDRGETYWWGERAAGPPRKGSKFLAEVLMPWLIKYMGVSPDRNDHMLLSYSKGGCVVVSQMLLYPDVWGVGGSKDGAFLNAHPDNNSGSDFDSAGIYALFDPKQILTANVSSVNDKKRLTIVSGIIWNADNVSFKAQLDAAGVQYDTQPVTESVHAWGPTGVNGGWTPVLVANMFAQRAAMADPGYKRSSMFFMG